MKSFFARNVRVLAVCLVAVVAASAGAVTPDPGSAPATRPVTMPLMLVLQGPIEQGAMVVGHTTPGAAVTIGERAVSVAADGTFVFGLDRDAPRQVTVRVSTAAVAPGGTGMSATLDVRRRKYNIQRVKGISERIMNPTVEDLVRIDAENAQVARARSRDDDRLDFLQRFIWPADGPITGVFGSQRYYNGVPKRPHYGVDMGVPVGTPVQAPAGGVVTLAHPDMFYSGGTVIIDHGHGISSTLMHLSEVLVKEGDRVEQGQLVAKSGASGRASGPHLDWRMNWFGEHIDARKLVSPR